YVEMMAMKNNFTSVHELKQACLPALKELFPEDTFNGLLKVIYLVLDQTRPIVVTKCNIRLFLSKEPTSFESALQRCLDEGLYSRINILYDDISADDLTLFFNKIKGN